MTSRILKKILPLLLFLCFSGLKAEDDALSPLIRNLILNSDHIVTGVLDNIVTETQGHKTICKGSLKIEDIISSDCKPGDVITVAWETHELLPIHHESFKGIQVIWLLQKKGDIYYANHPDRLQSLEDFEGIYKEINNYSTRVYLPEIYYWQDSAKPVLLIFRNIEAGIVKLPAIEWQDKVLKINDKVQLSVYPITSFNREKTILGKEPLSALEGKSQVSTDTFKDLKTDSEYRVWVDLNSIYNFKKNAYYSVSLNIKGFPSQNISAFETRSHMKIPSKYDFLSIAKDRFSSEQKKYTVQVMMEAVGETNVDAAFEKLSSLKSLRLSGKDIKDISPIGSFTQLEQLDLSGNKIRDLSPIRQMRNLVLLDLSDNKISNIEVVGYLGNLNLLDLNKNEIGNIAPLKNLLGLFFLHLNSNEIDDISSLDSLKRLRILDLSKNEIDDVKALGKLIVLQELYLQENSIKVLDALTYAKNLMILDVRKNPVSYVEHFDLLIKKHENDFGNMIELKLLHDAFDGKKETDANGSQPLLPLVGEKVTEIKEVVVKEEKKETFREQVEKATGIKAEKENTGSVVEYLDKENLVLIQFKIEEIPSLDKLLTVYRKEDYIGTVKVIEVVKDQVIGRIVPELINDKKLIFAVGDFARLQK